MESSPDPLLGKSEQGGESGAGPEQRGDPVVRRRLVRVLGALRVAELEQQ